MSDSQTHQRDLHFSSMDAREHVPNSAAHSLSYEVNLIVELMRLSRVMVLYGDPGQQRDQLLRFEIVPLLKARRSGDQEELIILFDAWDRPPLAALRECMRTALAQLNTDLVLNFKDGQRLVDVFRATQRSCNATFFIILDRFNEFLMAPSADGMREFEDEFVEVVNEPNLRANFLLVLDQHAEPLLNGLRNRIPFLGNESVQLPSMKLRAEQTVEYSEPVASIAASEVEQATGQVVSVSTAKTETVEQRTQSANDAPLYLRKARRMLGLALGVLICALVGAGIWFAERNSLPVLAFKDQNVTASARLQEKAIENPKVEEVPAVGKALGESSALNELEQQQTPSMVREKQATLGEVTAPRQAKPQLAPRKPRTTEGRARKATVHGIKETPQVPKTATQVVVAPPVQPAKSDVRPANPGGAETTAGATQLRPTVDQVYAQRAGKECQAGLVGALCREKIRYQVCAGKWTRDEQAGITRCYVW